jgi:hypothetical protein
LSVHYESKYAVCPYYHRHENNRICCEGTNDTNTLNLVFGDTNSMKAYSKRYCNDLERCKRCMIYQALDRKYKEQKGG